MPASPWRVVSRAQRRSGGNGRGGARPRSDPATPLPRTHENPPQPVDSRRTSIVRSICRLPELRWPGAAAGLARAAVVHTMSSNVWRRAGRRPGYAPGWRRPPSRPNWGL